MTYLEFMGFANPGSGIAATVILAGCLIVLMDLSAKFNKLIAYRFAYEWRALSFRHSFLVSYPVWGIVQQIIMFSLYWWFLHHAPMWMATILLILVFCAMHAPNYHLMFAVGAMEGMFVMLMGEFHNIWAVGIAHGMVATCWACMVPDAISTSFSIWGYQKNQAKVDVAMHDAWGKDKP